MCRSSRAVGTSIVTVGSSRMRIGASLIRDFANARIIRWPEEYVSTVRSTNSSSFRRDTRSSIRFLRGALGTWYRAPKKSRFSRPVSFQYRPRSPMSMHPIDARTLSSSLWTSNPFTHIFPDVGRRRVVRHLISVVLPAPFGPRSPKISPSRMSRLTSARAWTCFLSRFPFLRTFDMNVFERFSTRMIGSGIVPRPHAPTYLTMSREGRSGYSARRFITQSGIPRPMGRTRSPASRRPGNGEISRLRRELAALRRALSRQDTRLRAVSQAVESQRRWEAVLAGALQIGEGARRGDRGVIADLQDSIVRLEEFLLKTSDRIENILHALKQHREFLVGMNKRILNVGTKDRIGLELDSALVKEIERLKASLHDADNVKEIEKAKAELDRRFDGELKKFDLDAIWAKKKEIAGYG